MGVALHKPADNNGCGFVYTYRLMNGCGYHMSTGISGHGSRKYADVLLHICVVALINLAHEVRPGQSVKRDLDEPTRVFNIFTKLLTCTLLYSLL